MTAAENVFFPLSLSLSLFSGSLPFAMEKCEAINNKAKSKTKFNKRDSKRNVANPTRTRTGQQTNQPAACNPLPVPFPSPAVCCLWSFGKIFKAVGLRMPINQSGKKVAEQCAACVEFALHIHTHIHIHTSTCITL